MSYNVITKSLDNKLNGYQEKSLGAGNYLTLLSAPPLANVFLQLNDNTAPKIPFNEGDTIEAEHVERIYITADIVPGGKLVFGQSNSNQFKIIPAPKVNDIKEIGEIGNLKTIGEVGSFNATLLTALDKISNPYEEPTISSNYSNSDTLVTILNKTLTCDKIELDYFVGAMTTSAQDSVGLCNILLDNNIISSISTGGNGTSDGDKHLSIKNINGLTLEIQVLSVGTRKSGYLLQEFNKKA